MDRRLLTLAAMSLGLGAATIAASVAPEPSPNAGEGRKSRQGKKVTRIPPSNGKAKEKSASLQRMLRKGRGK